MNEEQKLQEEKKDKQEVITPEQTGEIVQHEVKTPEAMEALVQEVQAEEKPIAKVMEVSKEVGQDVQDAEGKPEENSGDISSEQEGAEADSEDNENILTEEKENGAIDVTESDEEEQPTDEVVEEQSTEEVDIEAVKKELEELKAEREEEAKVKELVEVAQHVEAEYDKVVKGINQALRETLEQYQIPTDKSIKELEKEDPAKAQIARDLIAQAKQALEFNTHRLSEQYQAKEQDVVFSKAERLFNKYEMSEEQQQVAAETFISILHASGLQDLKEDLAAKVELSVAQAKFRVPPKMVEEEPPVQLTEVHAEPVIEPEKTDEVKPEEEVSKPEEKPEEKAPDAPDEEFKLERGVAKEPPVVKKTSNIDAYKEGIDGESSVIASKTSSVTVDNVLSKLASLPPRERQKFTKENFALINAAMREVNIRNSRRV